MVGTPQPVPSEAYKTNDSGIPDSEKNQFITDLGGALQSGLDAVETKADDAQADATQGISDAAAAQSTADTAVSDAAAAQSTADTAVSDAAAAQSTADTAAARPIVMTTDTEVWNTIPPGGIIDFTGHDELIIEINPSIAGATIPLTIAGLPDSGKRWLKITKSSGLTLTFSGVSYESLNNSDTSYYFEITCIDGSFYMKDATIDDSLGGLKMKKLTFSGWDMQTATPLVVAHGISDSTKITGVITSIRGTSTTRIGIEFMDDSNTKSGGNWSVGSTAITLQRTVGQHFDDAAYASASGYITVFYID